MISFQELITLTIYDDGGTHAVLGVNLWSGIPTDGHQNNLFLRGRKFIDEYAKEVSD